MTAIDILTLPTAYHLRIEDYRLLDDSGAFRDFAKTELIEGVIVPVNAQYTAHARAQKRLFRALDDACTARGATPEAWFEVSIMLGGDTMPQPDVVLANAAPENGAIAGADVALVVEISDTTLAFDMGAKARIYATAGIPEYWVADINGGVIHQLWSPSEESYREQRKVAFGDTIGSATISGLTVTKAL